jgi:hypothetical protein
MGGNIVDSRPGGNLGRRAHCWVLKGQPSAARPGALFGSGSRPGDHIADRDRSGWWSSLGFGVRWGVCELDSGCEHLVVLDCCSVVFNVFPWFTRVCV